MRLKNSTDFSNRFLRRLVSWCCRQCELPLTKLREARFTKCDRNLYRGRAFWGGRILVRIGRSAALGVPFYPYTSRRNSHAPEFTLADRIESLVKVTAHEVQHIAEFRRGQTKVREAETDIAALQVLAAFRRDRAALLAEWNDTPADKPPIQRPSIIEKRAAKAAADLDRWHRLKSAS